MTSRSDETSVLGGHRTLAAAAAEELRRRILSGQYAGGTRLNQASLSREIGISRIPLREAFVQLDVEGLIKIVPHHGALVVELSVSEIEELFALRALLEPRLLLASAPKLEMKDFIALEKILTEYSSELRNNHVVRWGELNTALHSLLYKRADLPRTATIVGSLLRNTERHTCMQLAFTDGLERAEAEHAKIVALCRKGAFDEACAVLEEHIRNAATTLVAYLNTKSTTLTGSEAAT
jgi:DNA-binding GntR family transcriptional regulator